MLASAVKTLLKGTLAALVAPTVLGLPAVSAPACSSGNLAYLASLGSTGCSIGDVIYSDFAFSWNNQSTFGFARNANEYTISGSNLNLDVGSYTYSYKVTSSDAYQFLAYDTGVTASSILDPLTSTKTLVGTPNGTPITAVNASQAPVYFYNPTVAGPVLFSSTITITAGRLDTFSDSFDLQQTVPGPLPILGVAAAFRLTRRLRKRSTAASRVHPFSFQR